VGELATVDVQGIPIAYEVRGEGRPIVLVHGWSADHRYMVADLEPVFAETPGWRRIYPDLPGHGATPAPRWLTSQDQVLAILAGFFDAVVGVEQFALVGSSYGGHTSLGLARLVPERIVGLCLLVPDMPRPDNTRDAEAPLVLADDDAFHVDADEQWMADALVVREPWMLDELRAHDAPAYAVADDQFLARLDLHYLPSGAAGSVGEPFDKPSLVVTGRQDATTGFRGALPLVDELPRATWAVLDLAGHQLGRLERPVLFEALVTDWLDRMTSPSPRRPR
jgi:pimeloyl-ACP methyl ester carboxylesterase